MINTYSKLRDYRINNKGRAKFVIDVFELLLASLSFPLAIIFTKKLFVADLEVTNFQGMLFFVIVMISWFVLSRVSAMAKIPRTQRYRTLAFQLSRVTFITFLGLTAFKFIFGLTSIPVILIFTYVTIMFVLNGSFRILAFSGLKKYRRWGGSLHHVLVVADGFSDGVIDQLMKQTEWGFKITALMTSSKMIKAKFGDRIKIYSETENLKSILDNRVIDEVIYCKKRINEDTAKAIAAICNETGVIFRLQSSVSPLDPVDFQLKTFNSPKELTLIDAPSNSLSLLLKSMADIYFTLLALIFASPVFLLLAILIRIDSKGPVFFKQERIGLRGRKFKLYKFRTMIVDAEKQLAKLQAKNEADGPVFKIKHDPRITRVGRILRKTGFDELPQLINVVKGEMSLIGPRPPLENEVKKYKRWQLKRLSVKPGITCTWQVVPERHDVSFEEWMELDMGYIKNWSLSKDIGLFFKTVRALMAMGGH